MNGLDPADTIARINPIPPGTARPLWSVMIPTYNCANYLGRALESVLSQDPGPEQMQIEVVDDCSTKDDPGAVVHELGKGRVLFHRNEENVKIASNFNVCISRSRGHLIHILNGDDYIGPNFYLRFEEEFSKAPDCIILFSRSFLVDEQEQPLGISKFCSSLAEPSRDPREFLLGNPIRTPGVVVRRSFYERWGGFDINLLHIPDWEIWVRAITHGGARMLNEPLAYYRVHGENDTNQATRFAVSLRDQFRLSAKWEAKGLAGFDHAVFDRRTARVAFRRALQFVLRGDPEAAAANWGVWREHAAPNGISRACLEGCLAIGEMAAERMRARGADRRGHWQ